ncbi:MAG: hypothetical protein ACOY3Y_20020 [Acidobacteriota bacterium]
MRAVLSLVLATTAVAATAAPPTVTDLTSRLPEDADVVLGSDAGVLRAHPLAQDWLRQHRTEWAGADTEASAFLREAGLDPTRDVDAMVVAAVTEHPQPRWLALFAGRYDAASLGAALQKRGVARVQLGHRSAFRLRNEGTERTALIHVSDDLVTLGDEASVAESLAGAYRGSTLLTREVAARHVDTTAHFWIVANVPEKARPDASAEVRPEQSGPVHDALLTSGAVQHVAVQVNMSDALRVQGWAVADSVDNAELLRDALKGAVAAMRLQAQSRVPELVQVLREVEIRQTGVDVSGTASIPVTLLERLLSKRQAESI